MTKAHSKTERPVVNKVERPHEVKSPAGKSASAIIVFIVIVAACVAADLISKHYAFDALINEPNQSATVVDGVLKISLSTNPGIVFGIRAPPWSVLAATALAVIAVMVLFATSPRRQRLLHIALAMVLAGALGNAYDRLFSRVTFPGDMAARVGQVRDFIEVHINSFHWPTFNVADILLVVGVGLILLESIRDTIRHRKEK